VAIEGVQAVFNDKDMSRAKKFRKFKKSVRRKTGDLFPSGFMSYGKKQKGQENLDRFLLLSPIVALMGRDAKRLFACPAAAELPRRRIFLAESHFSKLRLAVAKSAKASSR